MLVKSTGSFLVDSSDLSPVKKALQSTRHLLKALPLEHT